MNELRRRMLAGEELLGTFLDLGSALAAEITAGAGFDWLVVDLEHGAGGREATLAQLQALRAPAIVRVPHAASEEIGWVLDHGAAGVLVPRVQGIRDAASAVAATRYGGARGLDPGSRASAFGRDAGYAERADEERVAMVQIETRGALDAAGEIAALPGVDALFVGPYDLGVALGVTPGAATPEVQEAARRVAEAARASGKAAAVFLGDPGLAPRYASSASRSSARASRAPCWPAPPTRSGGHAAVILRLVRIGLPAAIAAAGVVLLIVGDGENDQGAGVALIGVALVVMLLNLFLRLSASSTRDREREEAAREHFHQTGRWPDEE